jgi:hypothetical protein
VRAGQGRYNAANFIVKLPQAERHAPELQAAGEVLKQIGERGGDPIWRISR